MANKRSLGILFVTLVVVNLGFGIMIPILPFYVERFGGGGLEMGLLVSVFSFMQLLFSPLWGGLSDRMGRKPMMILGAIGSAAGMAWMAYAGSYAALFASRLLMGVLTSATLPSVQAYISDSTAEHDRGGGMGLWGAAFGLGMMLGPGIGGALTTISIQAPFLFGAGAALLAAALIWTLLPESLAPAQRAHAARHVRGLSPRALLGAISGPIGFLLILALLQNFALTNFEGIFALYAQLRYQYDPPTIGLIMTVVGLVGASVQGFLTGPATRRFGDALVIKASLLASALGFVAMLAATNLGSLLVTTGAFVFSNSMLRPAVASLTSKRTDTLQGATMGLGNSFMSLGRILGPIWAGVALDHDLRYPFLTGGAVMLVTYLACLRFLGGQDRPSPAIVTRPPDPA
jgi:DHA1 family multidrug resistance protein-like MFS transporter